jgi:hypothetical protein
MKQKRIYLTLITHASSGFADSTWKNIFYDTLVQMGHDVVIYTYDEACTINKKRINNIEIISNRIYDNFILNHNKKRFDIFISYYNSLSVVPELYYKLQEKVFCINYTTNYHQINLYEPLLKAANLSVYASLEAKDYFIRNNYNGFYMPFAGYKRNLTFNNNKNGEVSFIGTSYGPRAYYLWRCLQNNLPLKIFGLNWINNHSFRAVARTLKLERDILFDNNQMVDTAYRCLNDTILKEINSKYNSAINPPLADLEYTDVLSKSSIVLNIPESRFEHNYSNPNVLIGANLRDFEAPTAGSFLLTQFSDEISTLFDIKTEIETYSNEWELVDKLRFYLKNPDLIIKIAKSGHQRIIKEHLWEHRFERLLTYVEGNFLNK